MRYTESLRFAWRAIMANRTRSGLTMLGIVIGIASVISLVAVGTGSSAAVQASINRLGTNTLFVLPNPPGKGGLGGALQAALRRALGIKAPPVIGTGTHKAALTYEDATALTNQALAPDVAAVAPGVLMQNVAAQYGISSHTVSLVIGSTPALFGIDNSTIGAGRNFTDAEYTNHSRLAVVGLSVLADLTDEPPETMLGEQIRLNGQPFTVIGILASKGYSGQQDLDDRIVANGAAVSDALYGYSPPGQGPINAIAVASTSQKTTQAAQAEVQTILSQRHHVSLVNSDFLVFSSTAVLSASASTSSTLQILLAAVAGISLLVGGIGVMNIMLVSVTERTREIGIRKAIGADHRDIVGQFLAEAVILSVVGGFLGVGMGYLVTRTSIAGVQPIIAPYSVYLSLGVSLFTGLFFGLYPASRAAALRPIDALRYE
jgi:putative ABC transport system permease protein